jgi:hypothetical protein
MGSRISCNDADSSSSNIENSSSTSTKNNNAIINNSNPTEQKSCGEPTRSHVYINDKFRLEFLDCNCCCDTTKKIANCNFQGINVLRDLYEMVSELYIRLENILYFSITKLILLHCQK